jgi:hypothetical protein
VIAVIVTGEESVFLSAGGRLTLNVRLVSVLADNLERPMLHVLLDGRVVHLPSYQTLSVEDGIDGIHGGLILGSVTNQALRLGESNPRRCRSVTLIICNNLDTLVLPDSNTGVRCSEVDANSGAVYFLHKTQQLVIVRTNYKVQ